ncbi:MAG: BBP7 family outer membrane beta-barrel protein [Thermoguttaceae bacterium]
MPAGHQPGPEYSEESPDFVPYDRAGSGCCPADCTPGRCGPGCCGPGWCGPCDPCYSPLHGCLWVRGEYLLWWTRGSALPPLVTTSPAGTTPDVAGVLGQPGTRVLFGDQTVNTDVHSGERITLGYWFEPCHCIGIEASYLGMGREATSFFAASPETPIVARPYFDTQTDTQSAMLIAHPDFLRGSVNVDAATELQAVEVLLRPNLFWRPCDRMDFLVGWRNARLDESLRISQFSEWTASQGQIVAGTTKSLFDLFDTENQFQGAELGVVYQQHIGRWSLETLMKLGLGNTHSRVLIDGMTTTTVPNGGTTTFTGGLLAQQTNIGQHDKNQFSMIPELGVTAGCDLTCRLRATFGYTFLYWSRVARSADQLDPNVSQLPPEAPTGAHRPAFAFVTNDFWGQGVNFGLEYRF